MNFERKQLLIALGLVALVALAGCTGLQGSEPSGKDLAENTSQDLSSATVGESYLFEVRLTEKNQFGLVQKRPPFTMDDSLERQNLIRRYKHLNDADNRHHVYMMSHDGKVIDYRVALGKVSSVNSKLTNDIQIVKSPDCVKETFNEDEAGCYKTVESPQMDGSYGTNGDAIFFFTPEGHYVEYNGLYIVSEQPMDIRTQPTLVESSGDGVEVVQSGESTDTNSTEDS